MAFKEEVEQAIVSIEDEAVRAEVINKIEQAHATDVAGLKENNDKLINEKRTVKARLEEVEKSIEGLGEQSVDTVLGRITELERINKELTANPGDETVIKELERKHKLELKSIQADYEASLLKKNDEIVERETRIGSLNSEIERGLAQRELSKALDSVGVQSDFKSVLMDALTTKVYVESVGEERKVKFKHDGLPFGITDGLEQWARDNTNKKFLGASKNRGAGSQGSNASGGLASKPFGEMTIAEKNKLFTQDPDLYRQMKANTK